MIEKICLMTRSGEEVVGRRVVVTSEFEADRENIWRKIQDIDTLRKIWRKIQDIDTLRKISSQKPVLNLMIILPLLGKKENLFALKCSCMDLFR